MIQCTAGGIFVGNARFGGLAGGRGVFVLVGRVGGRCASRPTATRRLNRAGGRGSGSAGLFGSRFGSIFSSYSTPQACFFGFWSACGAARNFFMRIGFDGTPCNTAVRGGHLYRTTSASSLCKNGRSGILLYNNKPFSQKAIGLTPLQAISLGAAGCGCTSKLPSVISQSGSEIYAVL